MNRAWRIWEFTLLAWVAATLSFMAGMGITSAALFLMTLYFLAQSKTRPRFSEFFWPKAYLLSTLFLMFTALFSLYWAWRDPPLGLAIRGIPEVKKFSYFLQPLFIGWAIHMLVKKRNIRLEEHPLWTVLFATTALMALIGFTQYWCVDLLSADFLAENKRFFRIAPWYNHCHAQGLMGFHLSFASSMCFSFAYLLARLLWSSPRANPKAFWVYALLTTATGLTVFFSYSRIAIPALAVSVVLLAILRQPRWGLRALLFVAGLMAVAWFSSPDLRGRIIDRPGWVQRAQLFRNAWAMFEDRPWTGVGFCKSGYFADGYAERLIGVNTAFGSHAHNNFLEHLATVGIPGALAFLAWWLSFFYYAGRSYWRARSSDKWLPAALITAGIAFQINGLTQVNFYDAKSQHAMILWAGLVLALAWRARARAGE